MPEITLVAESGRALGSSESKRIRRAGRIPAVVYGHGMEAIAVSVDAREFRHALSGPSGLNQLLQLRIDGRSHLTLARVLQRHPVRNTVIHVDFQVVRRDEIVSADVPIVMTGEAKAVGSAGVVEQPLNQLTVHAQPSNIPGEITVDISELTIGDTIRVRDLVLPSGVTTEVDPEEAVVLAEASAVAAELQQEAEAREAEAAEAGEA
ncbi:MAG: 50S ribosomal protein L25, partial [Acidimicrobiaceae bacterium]|nr:50S ribosomal protein L25 [Acidimicrobiaceae bacterium]